MSKVIKGLPIFVVLILITSILFISGFTSKKSEVIQNVYQVYLDGEEIGIISSKEELEEYIDRQQSMLKNKFNVKTVYAPKGLDIRKYTTYTEKVDSVQSVYNKIYNRKPFTLKGYTIEIKHEDETKKIYVLDKKAFTNALEKSMLSFVDKEKYQLYLDNEQVEIKDTGSLIENVDLEDEITIKEDYISVDEQIFQDETELTKYLLFGTTEKQATYTVKAGDTIASVADANKLNTEEFLIANPQFTSENNLLYQGQVVNIGLINPQFHVVLEEHVVEDTPKNYATQIEYDNNMLIGQEYTKQTGENGLNRITKKIKYVNGEMLTVVTTNTLELTPVINAIVVKGGKVIPSVGDTSSWYWPTIQGYTISSRFGWRWGRRHDGVDISGTGEGSPIFASNNGTVAEVGYYHSSMGNYVYINHNNGYYTVYMHLSSIKVKKGQVVARGQTIGGMGNTGRSTGTHLHWSIWRGGYPYQGGTVLDPQPFLRY